MKVVANFYSGPIGIYEFGKGKQKGIHIMFASQKKDCGVIIYNRSNGTEIGRYAFSSEYKIGNVYYLSLENITLEKIAYQFYEENKPVIDKKAVSFAGRDAFGSFKEIDRYHSIVPNNEYNWENDMLPKLAYEESVGYCLHVRGFSMHKSSKVKGKGTFTGIVEKISYLKALGITTLELQPAYEFCELPVITADNLSNEQAYTSKINYWGYQEGYYYTPKRGYAYTKDASKEFKDMVKALHQNNMEIIMQFYFPDEFSRLEIIPILRFWHAVYHVDGFHLKGCNLPISDIAKDAFLSETKLWYENIPVGEIYERDKTPVYKRLGVYNDKYLCHVRGLLKGDNDILKPAMNDIFENASEYAVIKYLSNYYGFTMADMVAYQVKHNEANGEDNRDGSDYNCSWNCGAEGSSRKLVVNQLRKKQLYNAFALLLLSQGMPLFFMGDEFGNSQGGNNNPYCQDNEITWLNWNNLKKNQELHDYVVSLLRFRKENPIFTYKKLFKKTDYLSLGYPDISFHGKEAWRFTWEEQTNCIGFMLNEAYAVRNSKKCFYIMINMHWEWQKLALPVSTKDFLWHLRFSSSPELQNSVKQCQILENNYYYMEPRSICVFVGEK